jgi:hypothetical protein
MRFRCLSLVGPVLLSILLAGCGLFAPAATGSGDPSPEELQQLFQAAVQDAERAEPEEISQDLVAITNYNDKLVWQGEGADRRVLVVAWTSWMGYLDYVGQSMDLSRDVWVTVAPQVQDFCRADGLTGNDQTLRMQELLGLPPDDVDRIFVEFWARPADLFRPSPDPEITDREAELGFPRSAGYVSIDPAYVSWYKDLMGVSYGPDGYPWTRLGYTYDWGNPQSEVGLSEFVIGQGASVEVHAAYTTENYCGG